jgi:hypothetical protein
MQAIKREEQPVETVIALHKVEDFKRWLNAFQPGSEMIEEKERGRK